MDTETREALERLRQDVLEAVRTNTGELGARIDAVEVQIEVSASETRRHFDVVAESIRADVRIVAEGVVMVDEKVDRLRGEFSERFDRVDRRLLNLELRVSVLEHR